MSRLVLLLALSGMVLAIAKLWRTPTPRYPDQTAALMAAMDDDGDGRLSEIEFQRRAPDATPMSLYDLNHSGEIDPYELEAMVLAVDPMWLAHPPQ
ncbi:MAG: hypothetical protein ACI8RZ_005086 [Myxococcota bacterium]|jgi:hypothetical protein